MSDSPASVLLDDSGNVLATPPGTPATSALTVQGDPAGEPIPVTGTFSDPSVGTTGAAVPASAGQVGGSDGTNLQAVRVFDADTGGGTQYVLGTVLRKAASGGSVEAGTSSDPLRVDPTGTTTQPVSAVSLPLPTGAATETTLGTRLADATFTSRINTLGQKTMAASTPVVLASDQTVIPVSDDGGSLTVDGTVTSNIGTTNGLALDATLTGNNQRTRITDGTNLAAVKAASTAAVAGDPALVVAVSPNNTVAVTGTVTATNPSVGTTGAAVPASATQVGGSDGTNLQTARVFDGDTGGGTQYVLGAILRKAASGGTVEAGTSSDPLRVDPTGTTTQPISVASLPLPTGAATETTLGTRLADATFTTRINTLGQKTMANSTPVVLASDQTVIPVADNGGSLTVDGTVTANIGTTNGLALDATLTGNNQRTRITDGTNLAAVKAASTAAVAGDPALVVAVSPNNSVAITASSLPLPTGAATEATLSTRLADATFTGRINTLGQKTSANSTPVVLSSDQTAIPITDNSGSLTVDSAQLPAALVGARLDVNNGAWLGSTAPTVGQKTMANSLPMVIASDQSAVPVSGTVTSNIGTTNGLALDATLTGGTQKAITRGGSKGSTVAADITSTASGANHQPIDVAIYDAAGNQITSFGGGTQFADGAARGSATGTLMMVDDGTLIQSASGDSSGRLNTLSRVTDGSNTAAVKAASTAAVAGDPALVVAISPNNPISVSGTADATGTGALGALNATVQVTTAGLSTVGIQLAAGTLIGTLVPEASFDGGSTWVATTFRNPDMASVVFATANTAFSCEIVGLGGSGLTRVRVSSYTSGTANITLRASLVSYHAGTSLTAIHTNATITANGSTTVVGKPGTFVDLVINVTATPTGTTPTMQFSISEMDPQTGTTVIGDTSHSIRIGAVSGVFELPFRSEKSTTLKISWVVAGSSPSYTGVYTTLVEKDSTGPWEKLSTFGYQATKSQTMLAVDDAASTTGSPNAWMWTPISTGMTPAVNSAEIQINVTAPSVTSGHYGAVNSNAFFPGYNDSPLMCVFNARAFTASASSGVALGFGQVSTIVPLGITGMLAGFLITGATPTVYACTFSAVSEPLCTLEQFTYYTFRVLVDKSYARYVVENAAGQVLADFRHSVVNGNPLLTFCRTGTCAHVFNSGAVGTAPAMAIKQHAVYALEAQTNKPYSDQLAGAGRSAYINPKTYAQTTQVAEAAPGGGTPANTTSQYATLGGEFLCTVATSSENLRGIFGFQVPAFYTLYITDITLPQYVVSTVMGATASYHDWFLIVNSTTNAPNGATGYRIPLGSFTAASGAAVGTIFNGTPLIYSFRAPLVVQQQKYVILAAKWRTSPNSGAIRGGCFINGYYE